MSVYNSMGGDLSKVFVQSIVNKNAQTKINIDFFKADTNLNIRWKEALGWTAPSELFEFAGMSDLLKKYKNKLPMNLDPSAKWIINLCSSNRKESFVDNEDDIGVLLLGLRKLGYDDGDGVYFISLLPDPLGLVKMYRMEHTGYDDFGDQNQQEISENWGSLASFFASIPQWGDWGNAEYNTEDICNALKTFEKNAKKTRKKINPWEDPVWLSRRTKWIFLTLNCSLPYPGIDDILKMSPNLEDWDKEKELFPLAPVLANYWLIAHLLLGNKNEFNEMVDISNNLPGYCTKILAQELLKARESKKIGTIVPKSLIKINSEIRKVVSKNQIS